MTGLYNVLEKLRAFDGARLCAQHQSQHVRPEEAAVNSPALPAAVAAAAGLSDTAALPSLTPKEKLIHDAGLVSVLKQLHDDLDRAVADAYGWPWPLSDEEILTRLVALNTERAAEEARGLIRWLRPEYQLRNAERGMRHEQKAFELPAGTAKPGKKPKAPGKAAWPATLAERVRAVETALHGHGSPVKPAALAKQFARAKPAAVAEILETLVTLGRAQARPDGTFTR